MIIILWIGEDSTTLNLDRNYNKYSLEEEFSTPLFKTFYPFSTWTRSHCLWGTSKQKPAQSRSPNPEIYSLVRTSTTYIYSVNKRGICSLVWIYYLRHSVKSEESGLQVSKSSRHWKSNKLKNQNHRSEEFTTPKLPLVTAHHQN